MKFRMCEGITEGKPGKQSGLAGRKARSRELEPREKADGTIGTTALRAVAPARWPSQPKLDNDHHEVPERKTESCQVGKRKGQCKEETIEKTKE